MRLEQLAQFLVQRLDVLRSILLGDRQLPPLAAAEAAEQMDVGQVVGPVQVPGGFSILYLIDERQILTADPRNALLSLKQLSIGFPAGTTEAQATARAAPPAPSTRARLPRTDSPIASIRPP